MERPSGRHSIKVVRFGRKKQPITGSEVAEWKREGDIKQLRKALRTADVEQDAVAGKAAVALCHLGDEESIPQITELIRSGRLGQYDESPLLLEFGQLAGTEAIPALIHALETSTSSLVHQHAATALDRLGSETVEPLIHTLENADDLDSRRWAVQLLGARGDKRAVEPLKNARAAEQNKEPGIQSVFPISLEELEASE